MMKVSIFPGVAVCGVLRWKNTNITSLLVDVVVLLLFVVTVLSSVSNVPPVAEATFYRVSNNENNQERFDHGGRDHPMYHDSQGEQGYYYDNKNEDRPRGDENQYGVTNNYNYVQEAQPEEHSTTNTPHHHYVRTGSIKSNNNEYGYNAQQQPPPLPQQGEEISVSNSCGQVGTFCNFAENPSSCCSGMCAGFQCICFTEYLSCYNDDRNCCGDLVCESNVCKRKPSKAGEQCSVIQPCEQGYLCLNNVCGKKLDFKDECTSDEYCKTGLKCLDSNYEDYRKRCLVPEEGPCSHRNDCSYKSECTCVLNPQNEEYCYCDYEGTWSPGENGEP